MSASDDQKTDLESPGFLMLSEAAQILGETVSLEQLGRDYESVLQQLSSLLDASVSVRDVDASVTKVVLPTSLRPKEQPELNLKEPRTADGIIQKLPTLHGVEPADLAESSCVITNPIEFKGSHYGVLSVSRESAKAFSSEEAKVVKAVAQQFAITIHRLALLREKDEAELRANNLAVMSELGQSAMEIAHRLGNELGLVRVYAKAIRKELEEHEIQTDTITEKLDEISHRVERVLLLRERLQTSATELRRTERVAIPVRGLLDEVFASMPVAPETVQIRLEIDEELPLVRVVPNQVIDILRNLFVNALEAIPEGGTVMIRTSYDRDQVANLSQHLLIEVSDTGPGVAPEARNKIFNLFFSSKDSSGFGLWSARQYARANGGDLSYKETGQAGATFELRLPVLAGTRDVKDHQRDTRRVLHVDDDEGWRKIVGTSLREAGFQVTAVSSQAEAMDLLRKNQYDLVILDISLQPGDPENREGMEILQRVIEDDLLKKGEVILTSAFCSKTTLRKAFELGAADFFDKYDFDQGDFISLVKELLAEKPSNELELSKPTT